MLSRRATAEVLRGLPFECFQLEDGGVQAALKCLHDGGNMGKVVVRLPTYKHAAHLQGSHIVSGGLGGLGALR